MAQAHGKPAGFGTVTPYVSVSDARKLIEFINRAFGGATTRFHDLGAGHIHAEVKIGDSMVMIGQADPVPSAMYLYLDDVDAVYARAIAAGAKSVEAPDDKPYGDRSAWVVDPCGITWFIATHIEEVSDEEIRRRMKPRA